MARKMTGSPAPFNLRDRPYCTYKVHEAELTTEIVKETASYLPAITPRPAFDQRFPGLPIGESAKGQEAATKNEGEVLYAARRGQAPNHEYNTQKCAEERPKNYVSWSRGQNALIPLKHVVIGLHGNFVLPFAGQTMPHIHNTRLAKTSATGFACAQGNRYWMVEAVHDIPLSLSSSEFDTHCGLRNSNKRSHLPHCPLQVPTAGSLALHHFGCFTYRPPLISVSSALIHRNGIILGCPGCSSLNKKEPGSLFMSEKVYLLRFVKASVPTIRKPIIATQLAFPLPRQLGHPPRRLPGKSAPQVVGRMLLYRPSPSMSLGVRITQKFKIHRGKRLVILPTHISKNLSLFTLLSF